MDAFIAGAAEATYRRHAPPLTTTEELLANAFVAAVDDAGIPLHEIDGVALASFTLAPDTVLDFAWKLGLRLRWILQDRLGGASALNMLRHAVRAVEAGDANFVVVLAGDRFVREEFALLSTRFNRTIEEHLLPIGYDGANVPFALLTQRHMRKYGLRREDYAAIPLKQREWAARNPGAVYRSRLTLEDYLSAPTVAPPLCIYDCVPRVSGADAVVVSAMTTNSAVRIRALTAVYNADNQKEDGLQTGLAEAADDLWAEAARGPDDIDLFCIYDDYPAVVLVQLADLGVATDPERFLRTRLAVTPINTSGGQLSAGQAGAAGSMHGLVEAVQQLRGVVGERQIVGAHSALVTGYGMLPYRYGGCANAAVLEAI